MDKILKTILITSIAIFGAGVLFVDAAQAKPPEDLIVEYWSQTEGEWLPLLGPIFSETNFLPGQGVTRLIRVTNNSKQTQKIAVEAINESDSGGLASQMNIIIKQGENTLYDNTLSNFFSAGEKYLSDLTKKDNQTQYDFSIAFNSETENSYQDQTLGFDLIIGFQGQEGGEEGGGGGGGGLPPGLTIQNEATTKIKEDSVTITWLTSYSSTSQVIYSRSDQPHTLDLDAPNYGYAYSKEGDDSGLEKVTGHSVTITGLTPGTKYYYRTVSHGSLAISQEYTFTTQGVAGAATEVVTPQPGAGGVPSGEEIIEIPLAEIPAEAPAEGAIEKPFVPEGAVSPEEGIVTVPPEGRAPGEGLAPLLLASLGEIGETPWMVILATLCLLGLVGIGIREWELARKKKKNIP